MKRWIALLTSAVLILSCTACQKKEQLPKVEPQISQMRSICELAVMECYYHNVAKYQEEDAAGFLLWKKDKHFWIEYSGVVELGIDASRLSMEVSGDEVTITIPAAKVLSCTTWRCLRPATGCFWGTLNNGYRYCFRAMWRTLARP